MVDEEYKVKITRISPESPNITVMVSDSDNPNIRLPGGAANICYQLRNFNVKTKLFTWCDHDAESIFNESGINCENTTLSTYRIPRKRRFYDGDTQVGERWDIEKPNCGMPDGILGLYQKNLKHLCKEKPDIVIYSDYDKGVFANGFTNYIAGSPVVVDPKRGPLSKWKGCTVFKPNAVEASELSGLVDWKQQCDFFQKELGCEAVVITQGGDGVVGKAEDYFEYYPTQSTYTLKITGAGDCFAGVFALAYAHKLPLKDAAAVAFEAGALYVQNNSYQPITPWALQKECKFVNPVDLKKRDYKLVFTNGCFDAGLTRGHIENLRFAKAQGDKLVVALNSDASVNKLKGAGRPVYKIEDRMEIIGSLEFVDYVVTFDGETPLDIIKQINPNVIVKGPDYKPEDVAGYGIVDIIISPHFDSLSTTDKIRKFRELSEKEIGR
jgi:D-beta-D-heptose 7-phosphate kinase/D-beta-D-heptose 1-phosphate adenosyltransferase